ncbi:MAG: PepSY domain-containing protein [Cardiobacteriaceae bacterium]|nr:PepSY domain-containing protein [Cardiobacteriaceae bacterium]
MNIRYTAFATLSLSALLAAGLAMADPLPPANGISAASAIALAEKETGARATQLDVDDYRGKIAFDIELHDDKQEYDIRIDAVTGDILSRKDEFDTDMPRPVQIALREAVKTAERETGGTAVDAELEGRHGVLVYEIKLVKPDGSRHYMDIDTADGKILASGERHRH